MPNDTKASYLADRHVEQFVKWLSANLGPSANCPHTYVDRRSKQSMSFQNLTDALRNYQWPFHMPEAIAGRRTGRTFDDSAAVLGALSAILAKAMKDKDADGFLRACRLTLCWGGVIKGNGEWIADLSGKAIAHFGPRARTLAALVSGDPASTDASLDSMGRFNAGLTKIYSLMVPGLMIYDGRVGAALGWLVQRFLEESPLSGVPESLHFAWGRAQTVGVQRNPSAAGLKFPHLVAGPRHARMAVRASWVLQAALDASEPGSTFGKDRLALRRLEAALFMYGYDFPDRPIPKTATVGSKGRPPRTPTLTAQGASDDDDSMPDSRLWTRGGDGKRKYFTYSYDQDTQLLVITRERGSQDTFTLSELLEILQLLAQQFGDGFFALGNNVARLAHLTEDPGLGMTIMQVCCPGEPDALKGQAASYLGPVLEDIGLAQWNRARREIAWRLLKPGPFSAAEVESYLIRP